MIQRNNIRIGLFLALLSMLGIGLRQVHSSATALSASAHPDEQSGYFLSVPATDVLAAGEQKDGLVLLKITGKPVFKTGLSSWLNNRAEYINGSISAISYFLASRVNIPYFDPSNIIFPFHYFW